MSTTEARNHGITRRQVLQYGVGGAAGMVLGSHASAETVPAYKNGKAKAVIQIWLWGGPSHLDTFDPKPEAGNDYCGPLKSPISSNVPGMRLCELTPELAKCADKFSLIRSMTHGNDGHETAAYIVQTGRTANNGIVYPGMGAVVTLFKGTGSQYKSVLPPYIVLTQLQGRFSETGFLGTAVKPFATGGDPAQEHFNVDGVASDGLSPQRQRDRRDLLHSLNTLDQALKNETEVAALGQCEESAYELMLGDAGKVFDLTQEKDELRTRYGKNTFGQSCQMARRLIERGVPYVTINYGGWDTHKDNFPAMKAKVPELDRGIATLLLDLSDRGLLDSTIVWCCGEFGRTPRVAWEEPWTGGRHHYGRVYSALVAGGGFKGGHIVGSSDAKGESVATRPVYPWDLNRSMYELLGIDPDGTLPHPTLTARISPNAEDGLTLGGRLAEIM